MSRPGKEECDQQTVPQPQAVLPVDERKHCERRSCEEAEALGTELEVVGVEFDSNRDHHCWTDRELFRNTGDF